ncbi:MAG: hypothetical protein JNL70_24600 [Saprospiraceae bacterium]|nr:hypothetical protein [Saprospiraceae bacterium]
MKITHSFFIILSLGLVLSSCKDKPTEQYKDSNEFFSHPRYNGNFFKSFSLLDVDAVVARIHAEVPPQWQGLACQVGFYNVQGLDVSTDSMEFRYLDGISKFFPADSTLAFADMTRGDLFIQLARYDTAAKCLNRAYDYALRCNNQMLMAGITNEFALLAIRRGDYPEAQKLYLRSYAFISTLDTIQDEGRISDILRRLGRVYTKSQNLNEAHKWYLKLWDYAMTGPNGRRFYYGAESALLLADSYAERQQWDSAQIMLDTLNYFKKTYNNFRREDWQTLLKAKVEVSKGNCSAALPLFVEAIKRIRDSTDRAKLPVYRKALADGYACAGRTDSAIYWYKVALATPDSLFYIKILEALSKVNLLRGDFKAAYAYEQESKDLRNRIFTREKEQEIGRMQARIDLEQREQQFLAAQNRTRLLMFGALGALALGLVFLLLRYRRKQQELRLADQEKQQLAQQKQLAEEEARLKTQGLEEVAAELTIKSTQLEESMQLLNFKNSLIEDLQMHLAKNTEGEQALATAALKNLKLLTTDDWRTFRALFEKRFPNFFAHLNQHYPKLSVAETRLFLLIKLGFDSNEIADVLGISGTSVYVARSRLRQRLSLGKEDDLEQFIQGF